jgi:hypothetical protein
MQPRRLGQRSGKAHQERIASGHVFVCPLALVGERPNSQFGAVAHSELTKNSVQILLNGTFREMQFVSNLFIQFGLGDKIDHLPFPEAEFGVEWSFPQLGAPAARANSVSAIAAKLPAAPEAVSCG